MSEIFGDDERRNRGRLEPKNTLLKVRGKVSVVLNISLGGMMLHWPTDPLPKRGSEHSGTIIPGPYGCDSFFVSFMCIWVDEETRKIGTQLLPAANENMDRLLAFLGVLDAREERGGGPGKLFEI